MPPKRSAAQMSSLAVTHEKRRQRLAEQQQHQRQQQQQQQTTAELADKVSEALLYHPGLDKNLVYRYLPIFARLPDKTRDIDGNFILKLAAEPSGAGLQIFLEAALQHHQLKDVFM
ncbi:hypothetical protein KSW81_008002 [Nannochloris sp. 'desiccata']|nr:hypothetical protein KSW81_008002 [Chlorella desiccata (nom. nud.)]